MAYFFQAKTANEAKTYTFAPDLPDGDDIEGFSTVASGVTVAISAEIGGNNIKYRLSGGTAGQTGSLVVTVTTTGGDTLEFTVYVPIVSAAAQIADTARSYIEFALRKISGIGEVPNAGELDDALERLNAIVARWRGGGADIGAPFPLTADSVIYCPDWAVSALRYNLMVECADLYGAELSPLQYDAARRGLQLVKHKNLPNDRKVEFF